MWGCFFKDFHGLRSLDVIGEDRVTFETDYPHTDSTWPDTKQIALDMVQGLTQAQVNKVIRGNAIDLYQLSFAK